MEQGHGYYPEECDASGGDCVMCVRRTGESVKALTTNPTAEWASGAFQRMYTFGACRQMEHLFVWSCGVAMVQPVVVAA
jgi:hypothetical protein